MFIFQTGQPIPPQVVGPPGRTYINNKDLPAEPTFNYVVSGIFTPLRLPGMLRIHVDLMMSPGNLNTNRLNGAFGRSGDRFCGNSW